MPPDKEAFSSATNRLKKGAEMTIHTKFYKWIFVVLLACLFLLPANSFTSVETEYNSTPKYFTANHGAYHLVSYRHHSPIKFLEQKIYVSLVKDTFQNVFFFPTALIVSFLFFIQNRLKWLMLMPIRYGSIFVISLPR